MQENAQTLQVQPEKFETVLRSIGFKSAQRLGEPGEGRECLIQGLILGALIDETFQAFVAQSTSTLSRVRVDGSMCICFQAFLTQNSPPTYDRSGGLTYAAARASARPYADCIEDPSFAYTLAYYRWERACWRPTRVAGVAGRVEIHPRFVLNGG